MKRLLEIEIEFARKNSRPLPKGYTKLVHKLGMKREVLRTWFFTAIRDSETLQPSVCVGGVG